MAWLLTADLHFTDREEDHYRFEIFPYIEKIVMDNGVTDFFILGDLTDKTDGHKSILVNNICDRLFELANLTTVHIIMGNHDCVDWKNPYFKFLDKINNIHYYYEPRYLTLKLRDEEKNVLILPCSKKPESDWAEFLAEPYFTETDYIFTHMTFDGSVSESGYRLEGVSPKIFDGFKKVKVFSGDIHRPQKIGKVTYVGSPYYVRFGDNFNHRILLIEKNAEKEFRPNMKRKLTIEISNIDELDKIKIKNGDQVKLRYVLTREKALEWDKIVQISNEKMNKLGAQNVVFEPVIEVDTYREQTSVDGDNVEEDWVSAYCEKKDIDGFMKEIGERIYNQIRGGKNENS